LILTINAQITVA